MSENGISLIISTFKREIQVNKILKSLKKQTQKKNIIEIIICDSFSLYNESNFPENDNFFKIKYLNIKKNILSAKRNFGIANSSNNNIILLDDDCIPDENFIKTYQEDFNKIDEKTIISGVVDYPEEYILNYNHIKYKNSRHFKIYEDSNTIDLAPDRIVAMNMGFKNSIEIKNLGYFDERFIGYGFEDYEFAYRYKEQGFKLKQTKARIIHDEGEPEIKKYIRKYYHLGRDGMKNLLAIDKLSAKSTIYYKVETNFFIKLITKIPQFSNLLIFIEKLILKTDKNSSISFPILYNFLRLSSYLRGFIDRENKNLDSKNRNWYE